MKLLAHRARALLLVLPVALVLSGCLGGIGGAETPASAPAFRPEAFFAGATRGEGMLEKRVGADRSFHVSGAGHLEGDGTFVLVQTVTYADGKAGERRVFRLRRVNETEYAGTLTGASGPVWARVDGNAFHVRYKMKRAMAMEQWIHLQPDGRTALNRATVRLLGMPVARVSETITRQDPKP
ncbi:MAG: DUF3833 family protein [Acidobacteriota bacterium]|nr:DUF3833 family protein [Acidobacteriota bacterium]